jgi:hypothetical protein
MGSTQTTTSLYCPKVLRLKYPEDFSELVQYLKPSTENLMNRQAAWMQTRAAAATQLRLLHRTSLTFDCHRQSSCTPLPAPVPVRMFCTHVVYIAFRVLHPLLHQHLPGPLPYLPRNGRAEPYKIPADLNPVQVHRVHVQVHRIPY